MDIYVDVGHSCGRSPQVQTPPTTLDVDDTAALDRMVRQCAAEADAAAKEVPVHTPARLPFEWTLCAMRDLMCAKCAAFASSLESGAPMPAELPRTPPLPESWNAQVDECLAGAQQARAAFQEEVVALGRHAHPAVRALLRNVVRQLEERRKVTRAERDYVIVIAQSGGGQCVSTLDKECRAVVEQHRTAENHVEHARGYYLRQALSHAPSDLESERIRDILRNEVETVRDECTKASRKLLFARALGCVNSWRDAMRHGKGILERQRAESARALDHLHAEALRLEQRLILDNYADVARTRALGKLAERCAEAEKCVSLRQQVESALFALQSINQKRQSMR